ncbi:MAG: hypothetical protein LBJ00_14295 [Planctomycetaceae bacterium]|jgi:hypothetical protein|nr:hypothetical protein [Planctomycetaceae bacterium]
MTKKFYTLKRNCRYTGWGFLTTENTESLTTENTESAERIFLTRKARKGQKIRKGNFLYSSCFKIPEAAVNLQRSFRQTQQREAVVQGRSRLRYKHEKHKKNEKYESLVKVLKKSFLSLFVSFVFFVPFVFKSPLRFLEILIVL